MSRWKAFALHLLISAAVAVLVGALLLFVWRPFEYLYATGAADLLPVVAAVHMTIGPLLTLAVFRSGKRGMTFDLCVIATLQAAALGYGLFAISNARPIFLVAEPDRFVLVSTTEIRDQDLAQGGEPRFRSRAWTGPRLVAAIESDDPHEKNALTSAAMSGVDLQNLPRYYRDFASVKGRLLGNAKPLRDLQARHAESAAAIANALQQLGREPSSVLWLPMTARKNDLVMLIDAASAEPLRALAIDPW